MSKRPESEASILTLEGLMCLHPRRIDGHATWVPGRGLSFDTFAKEIEITQDNPCNVNCNKETFLEHAPAGVEYGDDTG